MSVESKSNEIRITRVYDAPVEAVWNAWIDPAQADEWWGPRGFTRTTHSTELKAGGYWDYTIHCPDGVDVIARTKYLEVDKWAKLVYDYYGSGDDDPLYRMTVLFSESDGETRLDICIALSTSEIAELTRKGIKQNGSEATWDRLAEFLEKAAFGKEIWTINRSFAASQETMFELWTDPDHLSKWLPGTGSELCFIKCDIKSGGRRLHCRTYDDGTKIYSRAHYLAIEKPHRIVYTQQFCDENENVIRHPMAPTGPITKLITVRFSDEGPEHTRVTIILECYGDTTPADIETFISDRGDETEAWTGTLDQLEEYLTNN